MTGHTQRQAKEPNQRTARSRGNLALLFCAALLTVSFRSAEEALVPAGRTHRELFASNALHKITLSIEPAALQSLRARPRKYVPATVLMDGARIENVRVHLKGHASFQPIDQKPSFTLCSDDASFEKLHLNNSAEDTSFLNESIGAELFRAAGIPAPDVSHAVVELNGRKLGVYVLKEAFSPEFLARAFAGHAGHAGELTEPNAGSQDITTDLTQPSRVEKNAFRTFVAMELLMVHRDGYALAANNFRLFEDRSTGLLTFLPAGMDQLFGKSDYPLNPRFGGEIARSIFSNNSEREKLQSRMRELLPLLEPTRWKARIDSALLALEPSLGRRQFNDMRAAADDLKNRISRRYEFLQEKLGTTAARPELVAAAAPTIGRQE
jgi:spore coat protein CotH